MGWDKRIVPIRCQAVDGGASNASTVWRQVATSGEGESSAVESWPSAAKRWTAARATPPPSGDRWLRAN